MISSLIHLLLTGNSKEPLLSHLVEALYKNRRSTCVSTILWSADVREDLQRARSLRGSRGWELSKWLVPPRDKRYFPWSTCIVIAAVLCIFFFMAGAHQHCCGRFCLRVISGACLD